MRIIEKAVFKFDELEERSQEKAHENYISSPYFEYVWIDESIDSLKAFCEAFRVKIKDYSIGTYGHSFFDTGETNSNFRRLKLKDAMERIARHETGYCVFESMKDFFHDEFNGDMKDTFKRTIEHGVHLTIQDMEYQESFKYFKELAFDNEWEFDQYGNLA